MPSSKKSTGKQNAMTGKAVLSKSTPKITRKQQAKLYRKQGRCFTPQSDPLGPAKVFVDRWMIDPTTGKRVRLTLHRLPGKGNIPLKVIKAAVRKVKLMETARKKRAEMEAESTAEVGA